MHFPYRNIKRVPLAANSGKYLYLEYIHIHTYIHTEATHAHIQNKLLTCIDL